MTPLTLEQGKELVLDAFWVYRAEATALINNKQGKNFDIIESRNVRALIEWDDFTQKVIWAGSDDGWDWWENFKAGRVLRTNIGGIHDGIADTYAVLRTKIERFLDPRKSLITGGHSQGGGPAGLTAIHAARRGQRIEAVHTFASPMWGDKAACDAIAALGFPFHAWVVGWDRIPLQPSLFGWNMGYCRFGMWHFVGLDGKLLDGPPGLLDGKPWKTWTKRQLNHSLYTYRTAIEAITL